MFDHSKAPTISLLNQRRKSSPECLFTFKVSSTTNSLLQKDPSLNNKDQECSNSNWMKSKQQSFNRVFHRVSSTTTTTSMPPINLDSFPVHNNKTVITTSSPLVSPSSSFSELPTTPRFLRSFSDTQQQQCLPPFSSSNYSYFSSTSYANSITLPAAPVLLGGSSISSLKKKKRRSLLRISNASSDFFQQLTPEYLESDNMLMVAPNSNASTATGSNTNRNSTSSDIELATEIGQGLLSEVRRMQSILQERQDALIQLEHEKQENQHRIDDLVKQLRFKNETEERLKEDIWNLELTKQGLSHQIRQLNQSISKTHMEQVRRERQENLVHQELELLKTAQIKWQDVLNKTQSEYETKLATLTQSLVKLKREKDTIALQLEQLTNSIAKAEKKDTDLEKRNLSAEEIQVLQMSLAQAHSMVESLKLDLETEKKKKCEVDALLRESQETIEQMQKYPSATEPEDHAARSGQDNSTTMRSSLTVLGNAVVDNESSTVTEDSSIHNSPRFLEEEISNVIHQEQEDKVSQESIDRFGSMLMKESCSTNPSSASGMHYVHHDEEQPVHPLALPITTTRLSGFEKVLPFVMHTMIGEWLNKYTRYHIGSGISNKSHQRFFWLHPYTKTLYWSEKQPGVQGGEYKAKSVSIDSFFIEDQKKENKNQPIITVKSLTRDIKVQCTSKDSHEKWVQSLSCLFKEEEDIITINKPMSVKNKRLSLLLEKSPPVTMQQKQKWRMSTVVFDQKPPPPLERKQRSHSMIRPASSFFSEVVQEVN